MSSQARTTAALKCFFRFLEEERIARDPARSPRMPESREALPDTLTRGEFERLLAQAGRDDLTRRSATCVNAHELRSAITRRRWVG